MPDSFLSVLATFRLVLHFHVSCTFGQTLSLCQCSCCLGVTSQIDLGLHAEIVQDCFHVKSFCASCSERVEFAFSAALSVRVLQLCVHSNGESILVNTADIDFTDFVSPAQSRLRSLGPRRSSEVCLALSGTATRRTVSSLACIGYLPHFVDRELQFSNSSSVSRVIARSQHSLLLANLSQSWSRFLAPCDPSRSATDHFHGCRNAVKVLLR